MILRFKMFLESQSITNNNIDILYQDVLNKLPELKELSNKFKFGNDSNCIKPITESEIKLDNEIKNNAKKIFDDIYGTKYQDMDDSDIINSIDYDKIYSFDIIKGLIIQSYTKNIYSTLNIENDNLFKSLASFYIKKEIKSDTNNINNTLFDYIFIGNRMIYKNKFLHDFLLENGNQFKYDYIKDVFGIKSKYSYELGGVKYDTPKTAQYIILNAIKNTLTKFKDIMYSDKFKVEFFKQLEIEFNGVDFKEVIDLLITNLNKEFIKKIKAA